MHYRPDASESNQISKFPAIETPPTNHCRRSEMIVTIVAYIGHYLLFVDNIKITYVMI